MAAPDAPASGYLRNIHVLVTRPEGHADNLVRLLEAEGAHAIRFPTIEIREPRDQAGLLQIIDRINEFDIAVFISRNAVIHALRFIQARGALPARLLLACVGRGSAEALKNLGFTPALVPQEKFDSEALLALPSLQNVRNKKIVIFRGETGRELLANTLRIRGAQVEYAECYRRVKPDIEAEPLLQQWARGEVHIVTLTSSDGLRNLFDLIGEAGRKWLIHTTAVVISPRLAGVCRELGFKTAPLIAEQASDEAIIECIKAWRKAQISL